MITIPIKRLEHIARNRPTGFMTACLTNASENDGIVLKFTTEAWNAIYQRFNRWCPICKNHTHDLADCPGRDGRSVEEIRAELNEPGCCDPSRET